MIADHEKENRRIIDWCGLEWDPACLDYRNTEKAVTTLSAPQVRKKIYSSSIGKWRHFEKQMAPVQAYLEKADKRRLRSSSHDLLKPQTLINLILVKHYYLSCYTLSYLLYPYILKLLVRAQFCLNTK